MASAGSWSVVGKTKKGKGQPQPMTKAQKRQFMENMPRIEPLDPVEEDSTIYDAFVAKEQQRYEKRQQEKFADKVEAGKDGTGKGISDGVQKKKNAPKAKKTDQRKRPFDEVIKDLTDEELKSVLMQSRGHFPDKPELWLKDLVTYMNMRLENAAESDKYLKPENRDFPMSALKKSSVKVISGALRDCSAGTLEHLHYFSLITMLEESQNGRATYGYKIFLQILARNHPEVVLSKLSQLKEQVKTTHNKPERCLAMLWALGQAGVSSLRSGIRVWLDIMLPSLRLRSVSPYCVQYLEMILSLHGKHLESAAGEIKLQEYFYLLDALFGFKTSVPADLAPRLLELYPQIKTIARGKNDLKTFFPSYLVRVGAEDSPAAFKMEIMSCVLECLAKDKHCYSLWCKIYYPKHLVQSRILMQHLLDKWEAPEVRALDQKLLQQTVMTFVRTNEESSQGRNSGDWSGLNTVCEEILKKMAQPRFPWRWVMFFLISTVIAIVVYDVYTSKKLKAESRTIRFLEAYGVLGFMEQIWSGICTYTGIMVGWMQVNLPVYYERVSTSVSPVLAKVADFCFHIEEYTREHRRMVIDKVYSIYPDFWHEVGRYLMLCWDFILDYTYWIQGHIVTYSRAGYLWVDSHIINGNFSSQSIKDTLSWSATTAASGVHNITISAMAWCKQLWT